MSRTARFIQGLGWGYVNMAATMLVGLWLTPFLLRHVSQTDFGVWIVVSQLLVYLSLMDFGVVGLLPREVAYAIGRAGGVEAASEVAEVVGRTSRVVLWQLPLLVAACVLVWFWTPEEFVGYRGPVLFILASFVVRFPLRIFTEVLFGVQDLNYIGKIQFAFFALSTVVTIAVVLAGGGLYGLAAGWAVFQILPAIVSFFRLRAAFPQVLPRRIPKVRWSEAKSLFAQGGWISASQLAQLLVYGTDVLLIGKLLGPAAVVPYACTGKLIAVLSNQPQLIMETAKPALSEMKTGEAHTRLYAVSSALTQGVLLLSGAVACGVLSVNRAFVDWWVGPNLYGGAALTLLLLASMLLRHWNTTAIFAIFCFGYERRICFTTFADGVLNAALSYAFISRFGAIGAPVASIISVVLVSLPWNLAALARESGTSTWKIVESTVPWFWRFAIVFALAGAVAAALATSTIVPVVAGGAAVGLLYVAVMAQIALRPPIGNYIRPKLEPFRLRLFGAVPSNDVTP